MSRYTESNAAEREADLDERASRAFERSEMDEQLADEAYGEPVSAWRVCAVSEITVIEGRREIAVMSGDYDTDYERMADNARLIAAAPQLAAVLREVADFWAGGDAPQELTDRIHAALAQAGV